MFKIVLLLLVSLLVAPHAQAKRVALIIGVGEYDHLNDLTRDELDFPDSSDSVTTPVRDALAVESMVRQFGFTEIIRPTSGSSVDIKAARERFLLALEPDDEALFFFSGHGLQKGGDNYLLGSNANLTSRSSRSAFNDAGINVTLLLNEMSDRAQVSILFLDACRTELPGAKSAGSAKGFTFTNVSGRAGNASFVGFAAEEGTPSYTGNGELSFYTDALVAVAQDDYYSADQIERFHDEVRRRVAATAKLEGFLQEPSYRNNMRGVKFRMAALPERPAFSPADDNAPPEPLSVLGHLQVSVNAPNASILIDGELAGSASPSAPLNLSNLLAGEIGVLVEAPGYKSLNKRIEIEPMMWLQERFILRKDKNSNDGEREANETGATVQGVNAEVDEIVRAIERDIAKFRLTTPAGNNALEKLEKLTLSDPGNTDLRRLRSDIVRSYAALANAALENGRQKQVEQYLRKIRSIDPASAELAQLEQTLVARDITTKLRSKPADTEPTDAASTDDEGEPTESKSETSINEAITRDHLNWVTKRFYQFGIHLTEKNLSEALALIKYSKARERTLIDLLNEYDSLDFTISNVSGHRSVGTIRGAITIAGRAIQSTAPVKPLMTLQLKSRRDGEDWSTIEW